MSLPPRAMTPSRYFPCAWIKRGIIRTIASSPCAGPTCTSSWTTISKISTGSFMERIIGAVGLDHSWLLSNTKALDLRFAVNRYGNPNHDQGAGFDPTQLGLPQSYAAQLVKPSFPRITGFAGDFG